MVIIIRSNEVNPDPRVQKYVDFMKSKGIPYIILAWNRGGNTIHKENCVYFERNAQYGAGIRNIPKKIMWFLFVIHYLVKHKNEYTVVHACDFDAAFPAYLAHLVTHKRYIFDVFDWIDGDVHKGWFLKMVAKLQSHVAKRADVLIVCEEERKEQINIIHDRILVMPNIPSADYVDDYEVIDEIRRQRTVCELVVSYVGVFDSNRGLEDILRVARNNKTIFFNFAGFGRHEELILQSSLESDNIKYWGKVDYNTGLNIMKNSDLIMALYYLTNPVHRYAAPNKFYEGLMLGVPIVTTQGTLVGNKTLRYGTGFVITEGELALVGLLGSHDLKGSMMDKSENARRLWEETYKNYVDDFMEQEYMRIVNATEEM